MGWCKAVAKPQPLAPQITGMGWCKAVAKPQPLAPQITGMGWCKAVAKPQPLAPQIWLKYIIYLPLFYFAGTILHQMLNGKYISICNCFLSFDNLYI